LDFEVRILPVALAGDQELLSALFEPLGYAIQSPEEVEGQMVIDLRLSATLRLSEILNHLHVLIPVMDNFKHYFVAQEEIDKLLAKGEGWLADHPAKELITRRALKHRRSLTNIALARLEESTVADEEDGTPKLKPEEQLEKPLRLHDIRLDTVADMLRQKNAKSVLDLGCGEGKLIRRLIKERGIDRIVGVDPSYAP